MQGTEQLMIYSCDRCHLMSVAIGVATRDVPGTDTGSRECRETGLHGTVENIGRTLAGRLVHIGLTTIIRANPGTGAVSLSLRDSAHRAQEWIGAQNVHRRIGIPGRLLDGYGLSSEGLACARMAARLLSAAHTGMDAAWWKAIGTMLRAPHRAPEGR